MLRYLPGLLLLQLFTLLLFGLNADAGSEALLVRAGLPALAITLITALWFKSLSRADGERDLARTRLDHEREREALQRQAASERIEVERGAAQTIRREERRTSRRANFKVGLAFAATTAIGVLFVLSELVTLGLITLTTGGGAMGGYWLRWRQTRTAALSRRGAASADLADAAPGGKSDADFADEVPLHLGERPDDVPDIGKHPEATIGASGSSGSLPKLPPPGSVPGRIRSR